MSTVKICFGQPIRLATIPIIGDAMHNVNTVRVPIFDYINTDLHDITPEVLAGVALSLNC